MEIVHQRCAGLDVHKETVVACVRVVERRRVRAEVRTFSTMTSSLYELAEWLLAERVTLVGMEATGVYWRPVWHILEASELKLILVNAAHVKAVPGRKSDVNDATWLASLVAHGLVRASFVPPTNVQEMRDLTRARKQMTREHTQHVQRIHKVLEDANIKITSAISDVMGKSGRAIIRALIQGVTEPQELASLGSKRLKAPRSTLVEALRGHVTEHHRFMLQFYLDQVDQTDLALLCLDKQVAALLEPFRDVVEHVSSVPGVGAIAAAAILAEIGFDMSRFPSANHLVSWATLCPRSDESAGKHRSTRTRRGASWLKPMLVQAAWAAVRTKESYERALFHRLKARRGPKKAIVAVAASLLRAIYAIVRDGVPYQTLGADHFDIINQDLKKRRAIKQLEKLGYNVTLEEAA
ncbi:MAG: IS110 family transposase [Gemmatimonadales bacterium]|jgi:transposase|nr:IS110 family transposase [Gemmatimonadales bacterium]